MATHWAGVSRPKGAYQAKLAVSALGTGARSCTPVPKRLPGALVEGPVADHHVGHTGLDGHGRLLDGAARRSAAVVDPAEEGQLADAQAAGDLDLGVGVRAEGDQAVDVGRLDAGVVAGRRSTASAASRSSLRPDSLENSVAPMPAMAVLPANAWSCRAHRRPSRRDRTLGAARSRTVPVTWSPSWLAPRTATTTAPFPSASPGSGSASTSVTDPVRVMVSPG